MRGDIHDGIAAGYDEVGFTMTVAEIEERTAAGRRVRGRRTAIGGATLVLMTLAVVAIWRLPDRGHAVLTPSLSPAQEAVWDAECSRLWRRIPTADLGVDPEQPPLLFNEWTGDGGLRLYLSEEVAFPCLRGADGEVSTGPLATSAGGYLLGPESGTRLRIFAMRSEEISYHVGILPDGYTAADGVDDDGNVHPAAVSGRHFLLWSPDPALVPVTARVHGHGRTLAQNHTDWSGFEQVPLNHGCEPPLADSELRKLPTRFSFREKGFRPLALRGDDRTLVSCSTALSGANGPLAQFDRIYSVGDGRGHVFGKAPGGAVSGTVVLSSGETVELSIRDGFFAAWWPTRDHGELPVRIEIRTPTATWVHEGNRITRDVP